MPEPLFPYQQEGARWLTSKSHALLADEMGLGKSAQAIAAVDALASPNPTLVLCPAVARINWSREFAKFSKHGWRGNVLLTGASAFDPSAPTTICSYDLATANAAVLSSLSSVQWGSLILDESHYLKSTDTKRTLAVLGKGGLVHRAVRTWALSGTPAPNYPNELWPVLYTFGATRLMYEQFVERYCVTRHTPYGTKICGGRNISELRARIAPWILRRRKAEVMTDLPPILFSGMVVEAGPVPEGYIPAGDLESMAELEPKVAARLDPDALPTAGAVNSEVRSWHRWVGLQKVEPVAELISAELAAGGYRKIVLFAVHRGVIAELKKRLAPFGAVSLHGGMTPEKRDASIRRFMSRDDCRVFIGQTTAAGTAISLTAAYQVVFVECDWVPATNQQAAMRVHRIGQTMPVTVRVIGLAGSLDERIQETLRRKTRVLTELFDPVDPFSD